MRAINKTRAVLMSVVAATCLTVSADAQLAMMETTPELERLEAFIGRWQRAAEEPADGRPAPVAATKAASWGPGETWMTWDVAIEFSTGQAMRGRRHLAWDEENEAYSSVWIDGQSAHVITGSGSWIDDSTFQIEDGPLEWSDGRSYRFRIHYRFVSPDEIHEQMWQAVDDDEFQLRDRAFWARVGQAVDKTD